MLKSAQQTAPKHVNCIYIRQAQPLGLGHAVLCARQVVNHEPFAVFLADDPIDAAPPVMRQMVDVYARYGCSVLAVEEVARPQTASYGIIATRPVADGLPQNRVQQVTVIVEKPRPAVAPSTGAQVNGSDAFTRCAHNKRPRWHVRQHAECHGYGGDSDRH